MWPFLPKPTFSLPILILTIFFLTPAPIFAQSTNINFSQPTGTGSPLVFGGTSAPQPDWQDAWDKLLTCIN